MFSIKTRPWAIKLSSQNDDKFAMKTLLTTLLFLILSVEAHAIKVTQVKNNKALLDLEGLDASEGQQFVGIGPNGKKKALMTLAKVKNGKAIANITKGQLAMGDAVELYQPRGSSQSSSEGGHRERKAMGLMAGYAMNKMDVKSDTGSVSLSGNSFSLVGFYQMTLDGNISVKATAGYESLNASGTASTSVGNCTAGSSCDVKLAYLGMTALVRYSFIRTQSIEMNAGLGLGFLFAMSKDSNVLDTGKVTTNQTIIGSLGLDYHLSRDTFIPLQFDYAMFPNNSASSANQMQLRAGYGWSF